MEESVDMVKQIRNKKEWVTEDVLGMMEERRKFKCDVSKEEKKKYKKLNNKLRRLIDKAKKKWIEKQCEGVEDLERNGKMEEMYRTVKNLTLREPRKISRQGLVDKSNKITSNVKENKQIWVEYVKELYDAQAYKVILSIEEEMYMCFTDWKKALDRVNWKKLMGIWKSIAMNWKDRRLINDLYVRQKVVVRVENEEIQQISIGRAAR